MNPSASSWAPPASTQSDKDEAAQIVAKAQQDAADRERDAAKVKSGGLSKEELQVSKPQPPPKTHNYLHITRDDTNRFHSPPTQSNAIQRNPTQSNAIQRNPTPPSPVPLCEQKMIDAKSKKR